MGRVYAVPFSAVAITVAQDLVELSPADDIPIELIGWHLGQSSDAGDAQDELLQLNIIRGHTSSGSGGSSVTPSPLNPGDAAANFTAEINNTTIASSGTPVTLFGTAWNVRAGSDVWLPEDVRPRARQSNTTIVVRMSAPNDSITTTGVFWVREL